MDLAALLLSKSSTLLAIFNLDIEDVEKRHLYYQLLTTKIFIFTYMAKTKFTANAGFDMILLSIPFCILNFVYLGCTLPATLQYIILVTSAKVVPMQLLYILALLTAMVVPDLELSINVYVCISEIYLLRHSWLTEFTYEFLGRCLTFMFIRYLITSRVLPFRYLWAFSAGIILRGCIEFKNMRSLAWVHILCSFIIWVVLMFSIRTTDVLND